MSTIKILPEEVYNKIAAGEVIARPASVVKELVENSIDAGATEINVTIEKGGGSLIRVTDNGCGMDQDDALLCFEAHATSKISTSEDIASISTLGFRGEAIPSIASISRFILRTKPHDSIEGMEIVAHGGKIISSGPIGCAPGTDIQVRDIFFNTPARKKFLKSQNTEERHIIDLLYALTLPYPEISFSLTLDNRTIISSPGEEDLIPRLTDFFGKTYVHNMIPVNYSESGIKITGFIAKPGFTRKSRKEQRIYVNGRPVEAFAIYKGIKEGYGTLTPKGEYPPVILFITIDPKSVDVNVHPAKLEVRFRKEQIVRNVIGEAVRATIRTFAKPTAHSDAKLPLVNFFDFASVSYEPKERNTHEELFDVPINHQNTDPVFRNNKSSSDEDKQKDTPSENPNQSGIQSTTCKHSHLPQTEYLQKTSIQKEEKEIKGNDPKRTNIEKEEIKKTKKDNSQVVHSFGTEEINIIGVLEDTYIIAMTPSGILIFDQHAAHERIMYERLLKNSKTEKPAQRLLLPVTIELSIAERIFIEKHLDLFYKLGIEIEAFGKNTILIHSIPTVLKQENIGGFICEMLAELLQTGEATAKIDMEKIIKAACTSAVKAHTSLSEIERKSLIKQLSECELPYCCPHGRPTVINISLNELRKRFGRTGKV